MVAAAAIGGAIPEASPLDSAASDPLAPVLTTHFGFTSHDLKTLRAGQPIAKLLPQRLDREIGVAGAIRIARPPAAFVRAFEDIERFESGGGFLLTRRISSPPVPEDFAELTVPPDDVEALRTCRPGKCDVKLGGGALQEFRKLDWNRTDVQSEVDALARRLALEYVTAYQKGGNKALAIYRDKERPTFIADEFADMVKESGVLLETLPPLSNYLIDYPANPPAGINEFFYWSVAQFGLKPVMRINHVVIAHTEGARAQYAIATKQLYASHYFHTALEVRALVDDDERPGLGHYLIVLNLARSDGLTGMFGGIVRSKARKGSLEGMMRALVATREAVERTQAE
jgi:hypothetical protein